MLTVRKAIKKVILEVEFESLKYILKKSFFKNTYDGFHFLKILQKKNKLVYIYLLKIPNGVHYSRKVSAENISAKKLSVKIFNISVKYFGQTFSSKK